MSIFILQGISALWGILRIDSIEFTFSRATYIKCTTAFQAAFWGDDEKLYNVCSIIKLILMAFWPTQA